MGRELRRKQAKKDGKSLTELIQDWVDENIFFLNCKCKNKQVKYFYR